MVTLDATKEALRRLGRFEAGPPSQLELFYQRHREFYDWCESPIEKLFWSIAYFQLKDYGKLTPQHFEQPFFIDFALTDIPNAPRLKVAIELDGHEFHKTKEQRNKDSERERYLMRRGWQVIRFTGTQVYNDPEKCVQETIELIDSFRRWLKVR